MKHRAAGKEERQASGDDLRMQEAIIAACRELVRCGLTPGRSGNVSIRRDASSFFVSPTGISYAELRPTDIPLVNFAGQWYGIKCPSSEWRMHRDLLAARLDAAAIVHTHSRHATALACTGRGIPPFHYMVAVAGGDDIRCAPYHIFGSQELANAAVAAMQGRRACLLANHGVIAIGTDLPAAVALAAEVEDLAAQYCLSLGLGEVRILDSERMRQVVEQFKTYGRPDAPTAGLTHAAREIPGR